MCTPYVGRPKMAHAARSSVKALLDMVPPIMGGPFCGKRDGAVESGDWYSWYCSFLQPVLSAMFHVKPLLSCRNTCRVAAAK
jgi:hypothetical protein